MTRHRDHNDRVGNLEPAGEYTPPAQLAQFNGTIVEVIPSVTLPSVEQALRLHSSALDAAARRPQIASASFRHRSLRRFV